jgi:hypothetical protein
MPAEGPKELGEAATEHVAPGEAATEHEKLGVPPEPEQPRQLEESAEGSAAPEESPGPGRGPERAAESAAGAEPAGGAAENAGTAEPSTAKDSLPRAGARGQASPSSLGGAGSTRQGGTPPVEVPEVFDAAFRVLRDLREAYSVQEAALEERASRLAEAEETLAARVRIAKRQFERESEALCKDREQAKALRTEVIAEAVQNKKLAEQLAARKTKVVEREIEVAKRKAEADRREIELDRREEQAALREMDVGAREVGCSQRETELIRAEGALAGYQRGIEELAEKRIEEARQEFRKELALQQSRSKEQLRLAEEAKDRRIRQLEADAASGEEARKSLRAIVKGQQEEVEELGRKAEEAHQNYLALCGEKSAHLQLLRDVFTRVRRSAAAAGLGEISAGSALRESSVGHLALGFGEVADKLEGLQASLTEVLKTEGRQLAEAVAEHVLACFHSHDPKISLEPVRTGIVEEREEAARAAVLEVAREVAQCFAREDDAEEAAGDVSGEE